MLPTTEIQFSGDGGWPGANGNGGGGAVQRKLENIRRSSNIIQALENLVAQCDGDPRHLSLKLTAERALAEMRRSLIRDIHS